MPCKRPHIRPAPARFRRSPQRCLLFLLLALLLAAIVAAPSPAAAGSGFVTTPVTHNGKPWRIGYYEGGTYIAYRRTLDAFVRGLMELGWLEQDLLPKPTVPEDSRSLWSYLATHIRSNYVRFEKKAFWSAGWDRKNRLRNRADCIRRLNLGEVDFMLAAGTWAGQDLARDTHTTPLTVFASSNPVQSGIVKSTQTSGLPHVHVRCDPGRDIDLARLFYNVVGFKRLGVTFEDTPEGRAHAGLPEIMQVADEFGFVVVPCRAPFTNVSETTAREAVILCQERLASKVDAAIIPLHRGAHPAVMSRVLAPYLRYRTPTFSQQGSLDVRHGALMSLATDGDPMRAIGLFHAKVAASAFNGIAPGDLPLVLKTPHSLAVNHKTARRIGFELPPSLVYITEESFETILPDIEE